MKNNNCTFTCLGDIRSSLFKWGLIVWFVILKYKITEVLSSPKSDQPYSQLCICLIGVLAKEGSELFIPGATAFTLHGKFK